MAAQSEDPWSAGDPWGGSAATGRQPSAAGQAAPTAPRIFVDAWNDKNRYNVTINDQDMIVSSADGQWPEERARLDGKQFKLWNLTGQLGDNSIEFDNGSSWRAEGNQQDASQKDKGWGASDQRSWGQQDTSQGWGDYGKQKATTSWNNAGSWNSAAAGESEEEQKERQKRSRQKEFKAAQDWYIGQGIAPGPSVKDGGDPFENDASTGCGEDFNLYDHVACTITGPKSDAIPQMNSFEQLFTDFKGAIPEQLENNIRRCRFIKPTPVQKYAIPIGLAGRDVMCCAQTGSGKTAAYLVPMLASMIKGARGTGAMTVPFEGPCTPDTLIMSPTRELCLQIYDDTLKFCHDTAFRCVRVYGQEAVKQQINEIARGADVCVATPGRLLDFASAGILSLASINCLVLDEADRMLEMGLEHSMRELVEKMDMPPKDSRQTMMFSATFPETIQKLAQDYLYEHLFVTVGAIGSATATVAQIMQLVKKDEKPEKLTALIDDWMKQRKPEQRMLIFTNSKTQAKGLDEKLWDQNVANTGALHGDLPQAEREKNLALFRDGKIDVMVATDVASRGLDISGVSHVVNYDLPFDISVYVQRIGRTGRIGHRGTAMTFIAQDKDNNFIDREEVLKELPGIMRGAPNTIVPDWLEDKVAEINKGKWDTSQNDDQQDKTDARSWAPWAEVQKEESSKDGTWNNGYAKQSESWGSKPDAAQQSEEAKKEETWNSSQDWPASGGWASSPAQEPPLEETWKTDAWNDNGNYNQQSDGWATTDKQTEAVPQSEPPPEETWKAETWSDKGNYAQQSDAWATGEQTEPQSGPPMQDAWGSSYTQQSGEAPAWNAGGASQENYWHADASSAQHQGSAPGAWGAEGSTAEEADPWGADVGSSAPAASFQ
eukprot:TRINITY_DN18959_c0_g1_i1.p1 TRINITY_DN18959_c0_g1~~TRINITY_DN18959_c0_g1_i1.p1  ORF type:complete len:887 (+),score=213.07 TRINITY_DN18959_c0_g1_i1:38-2698(+)